MLFCNSNQKKLLPYLCFALGKESIIVPKKEIKGQHSNTPMWSSL